jgi:pyrroline-5-carboxylate reductase
LKLAVIGAGKMGGILLEGFVRSGVVCAEDVHATVRSGERAAGLSAKYGVVVGTENIAAARDAEVILLGVKPWAVAEVVRDIAPSLTEEKVLVSVAAGVKTRLLEDAAGCGIAVVRAMPNTPSQVGAGMTALCGGRFCSPSQMEMVEKMFAGVGRTVVVDETQMDAVTGVSGSGPAFLYLVIDALAEGGVALGLARETATLLAAQTALGAAKMVIETGVAPGELVKMVTTPKGTTVAGIEALEEGRMRETMIEAVRRAAARSKELSGT